MTPAHATTVVAVQRGGTVAVAGDGQVTVGDIGCPKELIEEIARMPA